MMKRLFLGILLSSFVFTEQALAVSFYTEPAIGTLKIGDSKTVPIRVAVEKDECINTTDVVLEYSKNLNPVDISIGKSILSVWVEKPTINREENKITFAGGIPNGYCGKTEGDPSMTNILVEVVFRTTETPLESDGEILETGNDSEQGAWVKFSTLSAAYPNNGSGEKISPRLIGSDFTIEPNPEGLISDDWLEEIKNDDINPEDFTIELEKSPNGKYWIIFNTADKQTGLSHYEILEEPLSEFKNFNWGRTGASWVTADSPYVLKDQSLNSTIWVKAVDKAGNETITTLVPKNNSAYSDLVGVDHSFFGIISNPTFLIIIIILIIFCIWFGILQIRRKTKSRKDSEKKGRDGYVRPCLTTETRLKEIQNSETEERHDSSEEGGWSENRTKNE